MRFLRFLGFKPISEITDTEQMYLAAHLAAGTVVMLIGRILTQ